MSTLRFAAQAVAGLMLCLGATVWASPPAAPARSASAAKADPTEAGAPVPPLRHRSAFSGYRPLGELSPQSWRDANDKVTRIGGWRTYTREAHAPEPAASAASAPARSEQGHHDHHGSTPQRGAR